MEAPWCPVETKARAPWPRVATPTPQWESHCLAWRCQLSRLRSRCTCHTPAVCRHHSPGCRCSVLLQPRWQETGQVSGHQTADAGVEAVEGHPVVGRPICTRGPRAAHKLPWPTPQPPPWAPDFLKPHSGRRLRRQWPRDLLRAAGWRDRTGTWDTGWGSPAVFQRWRGARTGGGAKPTGNSFPGGFVGRLAIAQLSLQHRLREACHSRQGQGSPASLLTQLGAHGSPRDSNFPQNTHTQRGGFQKDPWSLAAAPLG